MVTSHVIFHHDMVHIQGNFLKTVRNDYGAAEEMYRRALDVDPHNASVLVQLAQLLHTQKRDLTNAEKMFKKGLSADNKHAEGYAYYAVLLADKGDANAADKMYKRALKLKPEDPHIRESYTNFKRAC